VMECCCSLYLLPHAFSSRLPNWVYIPSHSIFTPYLPNLSSNSIHHRDLLTFSNIFLSLFHPETLKVASSSIHFLASSPIVQVASHYLNQSFMLFV
jgi:hypothetical protein